jgi:uncharacterized protein (TIGR03437 family)
MLMRGLLVLFFTWSVGWCALQVNQIIQIPLQSAQSINSLTTDRDGNLIVTGTNGRGGFVTKLDSAGNEIFRFTNFGSFPAGTAVDANGDIYWIGTGGAPGFPPLPITKTIFPISQLDSKVPGFLIKFRGSDGSIVWAVEIDALQPQAITLDSKGRIVIAGPATTAPGFTTPGAYQSPKAGTVAPLGIAQLTSDGDALFMATYGGHSVSGISTCVSGPWFECLSDPGTTAASVLLDSQDRIWIAGSTNEIDLPVSPNALKSECGCSLSSGDGYLAEFSADGSALLYATYLGTSTSGPDDTSGDDKIFAAAMDHSGQMWIAGSTNGGDLPATPDAAQATLIGDGDGFLLHYDPAANKLTYVTYYGTQGVNSITKLALDSGGRPNFSGHLNSNLYNPYSFGSNFIARLNASGIETTEFLRDAADGGITFSPSGALLVAGTGSVIARISDAATATPSIFSVANSASLNASGQVSPGEIISIVGTNIGPKIPITASLGNGQQAFPFQLGGVQVLFDDLPAPILYVSNDQINAIVPFGIGDRSKTKLIVAVGNTNSNEAQLGVVSGMPGIFVTTAVYGYLPVAAALNEDGTINGPNNRAAPGSIISIFGTGFGALNPQPIDGSLVSAPLPELQQTIDMFASGFVRVLYAGPAPGQVAGVVQVNFRLPDKLTQTPTIILFAGGGAALDFTVWVSGT